MNKKILIAGLLVSVMLLVPINSAYSKISIQIDNEPIIIPTSRGNTLYVGGNGSGNYSKIQDAIDNASEGDTVFVYDDSSPYYENIEIRSSINLVGENRDTTSIIGEGSEIVIYVSKSGVKIDNFDIRNSDNAGITSYDTHTIISNCTIHNCNYGIYLYNGDYSTIINCELYTYSTIYLYSTNYNYIIDCTNHHHSAIYLLESARNKIINCSLFNDGGILIEGHSSKNNEVVNCKIFNNSNDGITIANQACSNKIINCDIDNNTDGIEIYYESTGNRIMYNTISNNSRGIYINKAQNNRIYTNNFVDNKYLNAKAKRFNYWNESYPIGGNYWDDYNGTDDDGDGIGDTPYPIPDGIHEDSLPLMEPWYGNIPPIVYFTHSPKIPSPTYYVNFDASGSYDIDGVITFYEWDWDNDGIYDENHTIPITIHSWWESGTYSVTCRVTDDYGSFSTMTKTLIVDAPPEKPIVTGPDVGLPNVKYNYSFVSFDPEDSDLKYHVVWWQDYYNWDSDDFGPYPNGTMFTVQYAYEWKDTFVLRVTAKDSVGLVSEPAYKTIIMPRDKTVPNSLFSWFLERYPLLNRLLSLTGMI